MNNPQKTNHGKMPIGTESNNEFLQALRNNGKEKFDARVHSVSDIDFVLSTPFATYKIPRSYFVTLAKASGEELLNLNFCKIVIESEKHGVKCV